MPTISICVTHQETPVIAALKRLIAKNKHHHYDFIIASCEQHYLPEDVDIRILGGFDYQSYNYLSEEVVESEYQMWAAPEYIEKRGIPNSLQDLKGHVLVKPGKSNVVQSIGRVTHPVGDSKLPKLVLIDSNSNYFTAADRGFGLVVVVNKANALRPNKLERLPDICDDHYGSYHIQVHKSKKEDPFVKDFYLEYKKVMHCNSYAEIV